MPIRYSGGPIVNRDIDTSGGASPTIALLKTAFLDAGWTDIGVVVGTNILTFVSNPTANHWSRMLNLPANTNMTFGYVVANPTGLQVLIGATKEDTASNFVTVWNNSTAGTYITATLDGNHIHFVAIHGDAYFATFDTSNAGLTAWTYTSMHGGEERLRSKRTPQGLQCDIRIWTCSSHPAFVRLRLTSIDGTVDPCGWIDAVVNGSGGVLMIATASQRYWKVVISPYQFFICVIGMYTGQTWGSGGVPYLPENTAPLQIVSMMDSLVTTSAAHGLETGDYCYLADVAGMSGANGYWQITKVSGTQFIISNTVTGNYENSGGFTRAISISGATNASPIIITTSSAHGFVSGQSITIASVAGNTAANGKWNITVTGGDTFELDNSTGNGDYTNGGTASKWYVLSGATNDAPIEVATGEAHGLTTGDSITISGVKGNTAANGTWAVTVADPTSFTLDSSDGSGSGTYQSNQAKVGTSRHISLAFWAYCRTADTNSIDAGFRCGFRSFTGYAGYTPAHVALNQYNWSTGGLNTEFQGPRIAQLTGDRDWFGGRAAMYEPIVGWSTDNATAPNYLVGTLWDAVACNRGITMDLETEFDGYRWRNFTHPYSSGNAMFSLWLAFAELPS